MRVFLNAILAFIGASSLTDEEYATVVSTVQEYSQSTYDDLARVLNLRDAVSTDQDRLVAYFTAKGVSIASLETGKTNIFIGSVLE